MCRTCRSSVSPPAKLGSGLDPCAVLTGAEEEAAPGALVVAPYRVPSGGALTDPAGNSCAYYTVAGVVDREADSAESLEGPWDEVAMGASGSSP